jgi:AP-3 complex subunit beta
MVSILLGEQRYFEETLPVSELKDLLDAGSMSTARGQAERIRGLKWLLAMISKGTDVSRFFPDVIRNIMTPNLELKKLVYMYVLHYADHDEASRSAALLSINAFQRDLNDDHELIRGLALRTLTSVRVEDIQAVQALAVRTCARDVSPYVRKIAANAVTKVCLNLPKTSDLRETFEDEVLSKLLMDASPSVMGSAASALLEICPERFDIVHIAFERLLNALPEVDEWGQIAILSLLERYARHSFTDPVIPEGEVDFDEDGGTKGRGGTSTTSAVDEEVEPGSYKRKWQGVVLAPVAAPTTAKRKLPTKSELDSFLEDDKPMVPEPEHIKTPSPAPQPVKSTANATGSASAESSERYPIHEKHKRLLRAALPMLKSRNSGVVMAAASTMWYCGQRSKSAMQRVAQAMIRLVRSQHREVRFCALKAVLPLIQERPGAFVPHLADFFVNAASDAPFVRKLKLEILCRLVKEKSLPTVLRELETYVTHSNELFASQAVRTVGRIAVQNKRPVARDCLLGLAGFVQSDACSHKVLEESLVVLRDVFHRLGAQLDADESGVLKDMLRGFDRVPLQLPRARSSLIWLCRAFYADCNDEAGDVLRSVASTFAEDASEVKLQALSLAAVCAANEPQLSSYVFELGSFDTSFDVRDWARFLSAGKCPLPPMEAHKTGTLSEEMLGETAGSDQTFEVDTLSFMVGKEVAGYSPLPSWATQPRLNYPSRHAKSSSSSETESPSGSGSDSEEEEDDEQEEEETVVQDEHKSNGNSAKQPPIHKPLPPKNAGNDQPGILPPPIPISVAPPPIVPKLPERTPEFVQVLSHVRGQGLQVEAWFSREGVPADKVGFTPVRVKLMNKLDDRPLTKVRVERSDVVVPLSEAIESLGPGFHREDCRLLVKFGGHWRTPVKIIVSTEETGKLAVELRAPAGELLVPDEALLLDDFVRLRRQLVGMNETTARLANPKGFDVCKRVLDVANMHAIVSPTSTSLTDNFSFRFAARRTDSAGTRVILEIQVALDGLLDFSLHCEYALAGQALMDELKAAFQ